jgi:hypothetical protein
VGDVQQLVDHVRFVERTSVDDREPPPLHDHADHLGAGQAVLAGDLQRVDGFDAAAVVRQPEAQLPFAHQRGGTTGGVNDTWYHYKRY